MCIQYQIFKIFTYLINFDCLPIYCNCRESPDTTLFIMKEIYASLGIEADSKIPQQTMSIERPSPSSSALNNALETK